MILNICNYINNNENDNIQLINDYIKLLNDSNKYIMHRALIIYSIY